MRFFDIIDQISVFCDLIHQEHTGTPNEFALRLGISRTLLYDMIDEMRSKDIQIKYSRTRRTFYFSTPVNINISVTMQILSKNEIQNMTGGMHLSSSVLSGERKKCKFV